MSGEHAGNLECHYLAQEVAGYSWEVLAHPDIEEHHSLGVDTGWERLAAGTAGEQGRKFC